MTWEKFRDKICSIFNIDWTDVSTGSKKGLADFYYEYEQFFEKQDKQERIGDLEKRLEELKGRFDDYEIVLDSICNGNLGSLGKFIEKAIKAAVKDRFNDLERSLKFEVGRVDEEIRNLKEQINDLQSSKKLDKSKNTSELHIWSDLLSLLEESKDVKSSELANKIIEYFKQSGWGPLSKDEQQTEYKDSDKQVK